MIAPRFRRFALLAVVAVVAVGVSACSNTASDAATISYRDSGGSHTIHITQSSFRKELAGLLGSKQFQTFLTTQAGFTLLGDQKLATGTDLSSSYLSQLVEGAALDAELSALHLSVTSDIRTQAVEQTKQEFPLRNELSQDSSGNTTFVGTGIVYASFPKWLQTILVDRTAKLLTLRQYYGSPTPAKEQALYDEFASTICPSGRMVAQIQVKDAATANAVLAQLQSGASFVDLAKSKSTDTTTAKSGGSLGCLTTNTVNKAFATAALAAPFGTPVGPVQSSLGYHVILVTHASFADVQAELTAALQQNPYLGRDLRLESMHVRINPQFGTGAVGIDSQAGGIVFHVTPPAVPTARDCREKTAACSGTTTTTTVPTVPAGG